MKNTPKGPVRSGEGFTRRLNLPYLLGVYLVANAVRDLYLVVDGPDCVVHKAEFIHGKHDRNSTLLDPGGRHRIVFTNVTVNDAASDWEGRLTGRVREVRSLPGCGAVLLTAMPVCALTGMQYERVPRALKGRGAPLAVLDAGSLHGDWLDGYASALAALASSLPLPGASARRPKKGRLLKAAVVGMLHHRNEGDVQGDIAELGRLLHGAGLELVSVWPDKDVRQFGRAGSADIIVSLPYGRKAARILAKRSRAKLVEAGLPLGIDASCQWVRAAGKAAGRGLEAERFIETETRRVFDSLESVLPSVFLGRKLSFFLDPHAAAAFARFAGELGLRIGAAAVVGRKEHLPGVQGLLFEPRRPALEAALADPGELVVANSLILEDEALPAALARMEMGFPSWYTHALTPRPSLGFQGVLSLAERMADAMAAERGRR